MPPKRKAASREFIDDSDDPDDTGNKTKKGKVQQQAAASYKDDEMLPISAKRFIRVRDFNGKTLVDIREYYTDDSGETKPGRKGISLSLDQWEKLKDLIPTIDTKIQEK